MAPARVLGTWFTILVQATLIIAQGIPDNIGINWGTISSHLLNPHIVVGMLKDNGIKKVKLFDANSWTLNSFANTNIEIIVGIPNNKLQTLADDYETAKDWVKENITEYVRGGKVNIKYVAVGNEPFLRTYNGTYVHPTFAALKNVQKALNEAGVGDKIKVTSPLNADVYDSASGIPSDGEFRSDIKDLMVQIVQYFKQNGSPFLVNIYPFLSLYENPNFPEEFAFFGDAAKPLYDKGIKYTNVFDANFDTLVWSLKRAGTPDLKIIVGEVGWPTDGDKSANNDNAKKFYDGFFKKVANNSGTPLRPGKLEIYLFGLLDEDMKSIQPGFFERHWGIFRWDGTPKFPLDISGTGKDQMLVGAKGVQYLHRQWCIYNMDAQNPDGIAPQISYACTYADCSSLTPGSSCENLDKYARASYAFNMYYQMQDQNERACDFGNLAMVVRDSDPSTKSCSFPIQIVSAGKKGGVMKGVMVLAGVLLGLFST
ncbi:hypothetical protein SLE2022_298640 [Rubroshorea leprosula]